jgi:hypothetical protein
VERLAVVEQIAVLLAVTPGEDTASGLLRVQDVDAMSALHLPRCSFVLSLGLEPGEDEATYAHGYIRSLDNGGIYPIRSNRSLFDALRVYLQGNASEE